MRHLPSFKFFMQPLDFCQVGLHAWIFGLVLLLNLLYNQLRVAMDMQPFYPHSCSQPQAYQESLVLRLFEALNTNRMTYSTLIHSGSGEVRTRPAPNPCSLEDQSTCINHDGEETVRASSAIRSSSSSGLANEVNSEMKFATAWALIAVLGLYLISYWPTSMAHLIRWLKVSGLCTTYLKG